MVGRSGERRPQVGDVCSLGNRQAVERLMCQRSSGESVRPARSALTFCSLALTFWFAICMCRTQSLRPSFVMEASAENDLAADDSAARSVEDIFGGGARGCGGREWRTRMGGLSDLDGADVVRCGYERWIG